MKLLIGSLQLGLLYGILALGIYISFRILSVPDLTTEGSFAFGLSVSAAVTAAGHPVLAIPAALVAGAVAGSITGILQTYFMVHPILAGIITMSGLYSVNLFIMGGASNLSLVRSDTLFKIIPVLSKQDTQTVLSLIACLLTLLLLILFFKTHIGMCIRAVGDNDGMVRASSINVDACKIMAFCISNAVIALSGALIAQYQGYADISSSSGILVIGLASVIIGEALFGRRSVTIGFISAVIGSLIYRIIIALATKYSPLPAYMLKLVSAIIVGLALSLPAFRLHAAIRRQKRRNPDA
ncbi:MAG: ABC transporter permease [Clostridia bacterium]|nr:ABC transporter permease [Clostridia bacterium]